MFQGKNKETDHENAAESHRRRCPGKVIDLAGAGTSARDRVAGAIEVAVHLRDCSPEASADRTATFLIHSALTHQNTGTCRSNEVQRSRVVIRSMVCREDRVEGTEP
jgi:hypothetical protein